MDFFFLFRQLHHLQISLFFASSSLTLSSPPPLLSLVQHTNDESLARQCGVTIHPVARYAQTHARTRMHADPLCMSACLPCLCARLPACLPRRAIETLSSSPSTFPPRTLFSWINAALFFVPISLPRSLPPSPCKFRNTSWPIGREWMLKFLPSNTTAAATAGAASASSADRPQPQQQQQRLPPLLLRHFRVVKTGVRVGPSRLENGVLVFGLFFCLSHGVD